MPQMSPLYWEVLNLTSTVLVVILINKMFFLVDKTLSATENNLPQSKTHMMSVSYLNWSW